MWFRANTPHPPEVVTKIPRYSRNQIVFTVVTMLRFVKITLTTGNES